MNRNYVSVVVLALFSLSLSGCMGTTALAGLSIIGKTTEERCTALDEELSQQKLTKAQYRKKMIDGDCRTYLTNYVK